MREIEIILCHAAQGSEGNYSPVSRVAVACRCRVSLSHVAVADSYANNVTNVKDPLMTSEK
jgi:hypothetical protein